MRRLASLGVLAILLIAGSVQAQGVNRVRSSLLEEVIPEADRVEEAEGSPIVRRAYKDDELIGYVFLTSDLPPEEYGYSGPIEALVAMTPEGNLTGVRVTRYNETYMRTRGDFLRRPGFQEQFAGKFIGDAFRVYEDVDGMSRVTISVRALSRGVRRTARRVAAEYLRVAESEPGPVENILNLSWFEMRRFGVAPRFEVLEEGRDPVGISLIHLESDEFAEYLVGGLYRYALQAAERRGGADHMVLYVVDGTRPQLAIQQGWSVTQDGVTKEIPTENVAMLGAPWEGLLNGESSMTGVLLLNDVDVGQPMTFGYDRGSELGSYTLDYTTQRAIAVMAETAAAEAAAAEAAAIESALREAELAASSSEPEESVVDATDAPDVTAAASSSADAAPAISQLELLDFEVEPQESVFERTLANTSWTRVGWIILALTLATLAFFIKKAALRWVALSFTFIVLGYVDGGFLSVSHITSAIWVGPSVFLYDLPLLIMVVFTVLTVILFGRIFCGFLCPFGALQDFIEQIVPKRFQRSLPRKAHEVGLKAKYGVLAIIIVPALAGSDTSLYQYFEPFGTVFSLTPSLFLWSIAGSILVASAVVPRFYCRYMCPLGAALAIGSVISLKRIRRVEQCDHCKICEQKCPTGAIRGPQIDFKECVRCNVCEIELIEKTGVCRHDMEVIRPRLIQLETGSPVGLSESITGTHAN